MNPIGYVAAKFRQWFGSTLQAPARWFVDWILGDGEESDSGIVVNGKTALEYAPIWYGINKISGHVGMLTMHLHFQQDERTAVVANRHPAYRLLKTRPNSLMTAAVFKQTLQGHAVGWGNGRAAILRNLRNDPTELVLLLPDRTVTVLINGEKWHIVTVKETGERIKIKDVDVLHIPGFGYDGIQGYSLWEMARNSIGLGLAAEKHANKHFKNNAVPGIILEAPPGLFKKEADAQEFLKNFNKYHSGVDNSNKAALLRDGIKANALSMKGTDAQWIEQRLMQRQEAALLLGLEQILGDDSSVSYNSLEEKNKAYLTNCLMPWLVKWEQECDEKLLTGQQKRDGSHFFKFQTAALLRGTTKDRYEVYSLAIANRILSPNECRQLEDLPPYDGGDTYENPHTTTNQPSDDPAPTPNELDEQTQAMLREFAKSLAVPVIDLGGSKDARIRQLIVARLTPLLNAERRVVEKAAAAERNFCSWLDTYYGGDGFLPQIDRAVVECGGTSAIASAYAAESKQRLLSVAGNATADNLAELVATETGNWVERIALLADELSERKESQ